jgi:hypothetical protein
LSGVLKNKKGLVDGVENNFVILLINSIKVKLSLNATKVVAVVKNAVLLFLIGGLLAKP